MTSKHTIIYIIVLCACACFALADDYYIIQNVNNASGNPFDQSLNTTDNVTFNSAHIGDGSVYWQSSQFDGLVPLGYGSFPLWKGYSSSPLGNIGAFSNGLVVVADEVEDPGRFMTTTKEQPFPEKVKTENGGYYER